MPDAFLGLSPRHQREIIQSLSTKLGRTDIVLEKDVWVCCALEYLFRMPGQLKMAFKGGTPLSKVFAAIRRFSEDVDITLDYRALDPDFDPFLKDHSKTKLKKFNEKLKGLVATHLQDVVAPYLRNSLSEQFGADKTPIEIDSEREGIRIYYPSVLEVESYLGNSVLIEFGGRNTTDPSERHVVRPDIADSIAGLSFPAAHVNVLSPRRTFWEKATLMHVACHRKERRQADRLARHWYDLAMLADHKIGKQALTDRLLLEDVVKHKKVFFSAVHAHYDECLLGKLKLIPDESLLAELRGDFSKMLGSGMFYGEQPDFDAVIQRLRELENQVNAR